LLAVSVGTDISRAGILSHTAVNTELEITFIFYVFINLFGFRKTALLLATQKKKLNKNNTKVHCILQLPPDLSCC
jgi:hypothetical protein